MWFAGLPLVVRKLKIALPNLKNKKKKIKGGFDSRITNCIQWSVFIVKWALKVNYKPLADKG